MAAIGHRDHSKKKTKIADERVWETGDFFLALIFDFFSLIICS